MLPNSIDGDRDAVFEAYIIHYLPLHRLPCRVVAKVIENNGGIEIGSLNVAASGVGTIDIDLSEAISINLGETGGQLFDNRPYPRAQHIRHLMQRCTVSRGPPTCQFLASQICSMRLLANLSVQADTPLLASLPVCPMAPSRSLLQRILRGFMESSEFADDALSVHKVNKSMGG